MSSADRPAAPIAEPSTRSVLAALGLALAGVAVTRWPVARPAAYDFDELGYLEMIRERRFPAQHTLFLASARAIGEMIGDPYRGFVVLDMVVSALALVAAWWFLRGLVRPATAAAATLVLGASPLFWSYGAMAGNYTAIPLVGSLLLGIAWRGWHAPRPWHPFAAAVALALGTGYRQDLGTFWLPVFLVILWRHRGMAAAQAGLLFTAINLAWFAPMLRDAGGWAAYREATGKFAHTAGYLNSVWNLGPIDATLRYAFKGMMALLLTFGPALVIVPRGLARLWRRPGGDRLAGLFLLAAVPALGMHLLVHFGVPGYAFHYVPAVLALLALGIGRRVAKAAVEVGPAPSDRAPARLLALAGCLAAAFLFYPTDYDRPGLRGDFDLAFARYTRAGLRTRPPLRDPVPWRTANSQELPGGHRADHVRKSVAEVWD